MTTQEIISRAQAPKRGDKFVSPKSGATVKVMFVGDGKVGYRASFGGVNEWLSMPIEDWHRIARSTIEAGATAKFADA
jgi:hypothetical protein